MDWGPMTVRTVDLGYEQMLLLESRPRTRVKVIYGGIWLTEEGLAQDVFAASGEEVALKSRGLAVVEGLGYARVQVIESPFGRAGAWGIARRVAAAVTNWLHGRAHGRGLPARAQTLA
jgi:hypothetical protein